MAALLYGKSVGSVVKMGLGAAILGCSYLVTESWLLWTSGAVLTLLLFALLRAITARFGVML